MPEKIELSFELVNAILNYLGDQPFKHAAPLINAIQGEAKNQRPLPVPEAPAE